MLTRNHPISLLKHFRENISYKRFWLSPLAALLTLIFFSLKWTNWEADLSGWQIALGPWGFDLIDFPHSLPAAWLVFWLLPLTALFLLILASARLVDFHLRWLRFWAALLTAGCVVAIIIAQTQPNLDWNTEFSTSNLNSLPDWTAFFLVIAFCGLLVPALPPTNQTQAISSPGDEHFSRRKALLNIGGLVALGGVGGYLFTLMQAQLQRAITVRFQLYQRAYVADDKLGENSLKFFSAFAWSPDGKFMATLNDTGLQIWQIAPHLPRIKTIPSPEGDLRFSEVSWSPNGRVLAVLDSASIDLYHTQSGQVLARGITPQASGTLGYGVGSVDWSPDSRSLASVLENSSAAVFGVWEVESAQNWHIFLGDQDVSSFTSLAWSPDGQVIATVDGHQIFISSESISIPGSSPVTPGPYPVTVTTSFSLWDVQSGNRLFTYTFDPVRDGAGTISTLAWSPDGRQLALALAPNPYIKTQGKYYSPVDETFTQPSPLLIWDVAARKTVRSCWGTYGGWTSVTWSPDGTRVGCGASNGTIQFWNASAGTQLFTYQGFSYRYSGTPIRHMAWSPDGKLVAAKGSNGMILIWDAPGL